MTAPHDVHGPTPKTAYAVIRRQSSEDVAATLADFLEQVGGTFSPDLEAELEVAVAGGKRFRALCCAVGAAAALGLSEETNMSSGQLLVEGGARPVTRHLGSAVEFFQAAALAHDDIIDRSLERRGRPASHMSFAAGHRAEGLVGNANEYGTNGAILAGDFLLAAADRALALASHSMQPGSVAPVLSQYALMAGEVAVGQFQDMRAESVPLTRALPTEDVMRVVRVKAGRYSVVQPALLGLLALAGTDPRAEEWAGQIEGILEPAGIAFQLRDDALGAFGQPEETGKPVGLDIQEGKRTVLLSLALERMPPELKGRLAENYGQGPGQPEAALTAAELLANYGNDPHEALISELVDQSLAELEAARFPQAVDQIFRFLVGLLTDRSH